MRLIVDANILVGQLLRSSGQKLIAHKQLELFIAANVWGETQYELNRRVNIIAERGELSSETAENMFLRALAVAEQHIDLVQEVQYKHLKLEALTRIPRDYDDWHTVALAIHLDADIWTQDKDFLGCGVATWTSKTLLLRLH